MIQSMTGFSIKTGTISTSAGTQTAVSISVKSLNARFFEVACKLPAPISSLETRLIKILKKRLIRGHIYVIVHLSDPAALTNTNVSWSAARAYIASLQEIKAKFGIDQPILLDHLVRLPGLFSSPDITVDGVAEKQCMAIVDDLITQVIHERATEGALLQQDLEQRCMLMEQEMNTIKQRSDQVIAEHKQKIGTASSEQEAAAIADTKLTALYAQLDKIDVHEEIIRFSAHVENMKRLIANQKAEEKGKRIDFILQELMREINTITAKCSDAIIGTHAINIKVEIEKAREQAQNIV